MDKYCLLTNDVETHSIWYNCLRDETGELVLKEGMPILLDLYRRYTVKSTFYFTGYIAQRFPDVVSMILEDGHEVGCHGFSHEVHHGFDVLNRAEQKAHLRKAKDILEQIANVEIISFRAPALRVNEHTAHALIETGFKTDSSVASQRFDLFLSFGGRKKLEWLRAPRHPYYTDPSNLKRRGPGPLVEVPLSALLFPYVGTTMRILPTLTGAVRQVLHQETKWNGKPIVFDIHPNEFLQEGGNDKRVITRRAKGFFGYLLRDVIRGRLKVKNLGRVAQSLYEHEIQYFSERGYHFCTVKDYCRAQGFSV